MYVIATVICPNFHFSVSPHVPFLNLLFEQIANSNAYLLAKIGVDTVENEPLEVWGKLIQIIQYYSIVSLVSPRLDEVEGDRKCRHPAAVRECSNRVVDLVPPYLVVVGVQDLI